MNTHKALPAYCRWGFCISGGFMKGKDKGNDGKKSGKGGKKGC